MITDQNSFESIEAMIQSDGWKIFSKHLEEIGKGCMNRALDSKDDRERSRALDEYKAYRRILQEVYGAYKSEFEKYKQGEQQ